MLRFLAALIFLTAGLFGAEESETDKIAREVRAQRIVTALGEVEAFKTQALDFLQYLKKSLPDKSELLWSKVASTIDSDAFEAAIIKHYSGQFSLEELGHLDQLFKTPETRGVLYWLRMLPKSADEQKEAFEKIKRIYPPATIQAVGDLLNSALGRQLLEASRSAESVRREQAVAAVQAAMRKA